VSILCRLGLHKWHKLCRISLCMPWGELFECLRCHRREARYGYATMCSDPPAGGWSDYLELEAIYDVRGESDEHRSREVVE
jgi:hypothetical protein